MESLMAIKLNIIIYISDFTRYRQELGLKAVLAVKQVNDALEKHPHPEIFNTDQGAQCTSEIHTQRQKIQLQIATVFFCMSYYPIEHPQNPSIICKTYKTAQPETSSAPITKPLQRLPKKPVP
jgi:hypothetical protein